ncbi:MAG: TraR/DksA family transcriptional regulator [Minisyncoccota bacterium]
MINIPELKAALLEEKTRLESELSHVGYKNPEIAGDWQPSPTDLNEPVADPNDVASSLEVFEENAAVEVELEARLLEVDAALARIESGAYGICRVCGKPIEEARLVANPAAPTCIEHREG